MSSLPRVVVAVVGDKGVGKTSLISTAAQEVYSDNPPPVLPPTRFPPDFHSEPTELIVYDTSSRPEDQQLMEDTVKAADAVVMCFDAMRRGTLDRLRSYWMPELLKLKPTVPVVVACCKHDDEDTVPYEDIRMFMEQLIAAYPQVEVSISTSAKHLRSVGAVFYHALKTVLYPKAPLLDSATGRLTSPCVKALLRIFLMCDADGDGALNDEELNTFQYVCFGQPLTAEEMASVRQMVAERMADGLNDNGLLFPGFMYLHTLFLTRGRLESTWTVLKMFGYNSQLRISDMVLDRLPALGPEYVLELSDKALGYLSHIFDIYDSEHDGVLSAMDLEHMFNRAPIPIYQIELWNKMLVAGSSSSGSSGDGATSPAGPVGLTREAFLTRWRAFTIEDPRAAFEQMLYLGMAGRTGELAEEFFVVRCRQRKAGDKRSGAADLVTRTTVVAGLFGPLASGKSSLVKALAGRGYSEQLHGRLSAAGSVAMPSGEVKTLVVHEACSTARPEDWSLDLSRLDVAAVVFDSADAHSFEQALATAVDLSTAAGDALPVVLIAAKDDLGMASELEAAVGAACADLALPQPIPVSVLLGSLGGGPGGGIARDLMEAALHPEGHVPDTPARKARRRAIQRGLIIGGIAVTTLVGGYACYRIYNAGSSSSGAASSSSGSGGGLRGAAASVAGSSSSSSSTGGELLKGFKW